MLGYWKREYGVSYGYGGAIALIAALVLSQPSGQLTWLAWAHAGVHLLYGVRLAAFLLYRELCIPEFRRMRERIESGAPPKRLARTNFIVSCAVLYLFMSAPVLLTASVPAITSAPERTLAWAGLLVAALGLLIAAWGDTQKSIAKARRGRDALVTTGVFRYLRHPNYTGELVLWSASVFVGCVSTFAHLTSGRMLGLAASLLGLLGIGFVLARAATTLEDRQRESYGGNPEYGPWVASSWGGVTIPPRKPKATSSEQEATDATTS